MTFNSFQIDGRIRPGYYSSDEAQVRRLEDFSAWSALRPFCFSLIKGRHLPESFHIVLQLSDSEKEAFVSGRASGLPPLR